MTTHRIDKSYRIGRCNHCARRPVYAWKADTGLRLDDLRCPTCKSMLDRTSRDAYGIRELTDEQIVEQRDAAIARYRVRVVELAECADAWRVEAEVVYPDPESGDHYRCILNMERYEEMATDLTKSLRRLERAAA